MDQKYKRLKYACYSTNITMAVVGNLSPVLFLTFRELYHISYSLLGLLILINFVTQLSIDLIFSFFSHKFHIPKTVTLNPLWAVIGLILYGLWPIFYPGTAYLGLVIGTIFFSASSGFSEVLISPVIAAISSKDPDREMSKLHSVYAWGVVFVVIFATLFLLIFGGKHWYWLPLILALIPLCSFVLYLGTDIPKMETPERVSGVFVLMKNKTLWLCVLMIFFGGASEVAMAQWSSGFLEQGLGISKVWGDIFGVALFSVMMGLGRTLYSKMGKNITKVMLIGMIGATICYFTVAICNVPMIGLLACGFTGFCTSMLWPGSLIVASDRVPSGGVFLYALMAAGGDLGASVVPQLIGVVTDAVIANPVTSELAQSLNLSLEQLGMKAGMLLGMLFPLAAISLYAYMHKTGVNQMIRQGQDT